jgi:hypothetical protein
MNGRNREPARCYNEFHARMETDVDGGSLKPRSKVVIQKTKGRSIEHNSPLTSEDNIPVE